MKEQEISLSVPAGQIKTKTKESGKIKILRMDVRDAHSTKINN